MHLHVSTWAPVHGEPLSSLKVTPASASTHLTRHMIVFVAPLLDDFHASAPDRSTRRRLPIS